MPLMIVTGASSGLGRALAVHFASRGWTVGALARSAAKLADLAVTGAGRIHPYACDIADAAAVQQVFAAIQQDHGLADVLINNAGVFQSRPFSECDIAGIDSIIDTNLKGVMYCTLQVAASMKRRARGDIITISSVSGLHGIPDQPIYGASKHGVNGFCDVLAQEMKPHGVRVCTICPGGIATPLWNESNPYPGEQEHLIPPQEIVDLIQHILDHPGHTIYKRLTFFPSNEWH